MRGEQKGIEKPGGCVEVKRREEQLKEGEKN